jgi:hypothetical protein
MQEVIEKSSDLLAGNKFFDWLRLVPFTSNIQLYVERVEESGSTIFELLKIKDTKDNRTRIAQACLKQAVAGGNLRRLKTGELDGNAHVLRGDFLRFMELFIQINNLFAGTPAAQTFRELTRVGSLIDHEIKAANFALSIAVESSKNQQASGVAQRQIIIAIYAAWLHDFGRLITHELDHDAIVREIFAHAGINSVFTGAMHEPVPLEAEAAFDPNGFDSFKQMIVRICDLMGKVDDAGMLRTSADAIQQHSLGRQQLAFDRKDPVYQGKTPADIALYCQRERQVFEHAIEAVKQQLGVDVFALAAKINASDEDLLAELAQPRLVGIRPGL